MFENERNGVTRRVRARVALALAALVTAPIVGVTTNVSAAAGDVKYGTHLGGVGTLAALGETPDLAVFWVGPWTKNDWASVDRQLRDADARGVTPVVQWYYWGDDISPTCVEKGCWSSLHNTWKSKSDWNSMAGTLAWRIRNVMGERPVYVILETEFNKNGIATYEPFDGYLASQAGTFRANAPNARLVLGFGNWGSAYYANFDRAIAGTHLVGTQIMVGSTRESEAEYLGAVDRLVANVDFLRTRFGKPIMITDSAFSSYPAAPYERHQETVVKAVIARLDALAADGVEAWMYRDARDNPSFDTANYYGVAERHWGFVRADGSWKPAMDDYVAGLRARSGGAPAPGAFDATFSGVTGNAWWIQASVAANEPVAGVEARVNGGGWFALAKQGWGGWATSVAVPGGATVELRARSASGAYDASAPVTWGGASRGFAATFSGVNGNAWWVQSNVAANEPVAGVDARVNGGSWVPLTKQSWGAWAKSVHAPTGSQVELRARSSDGDVAHSPRYAWPQ